MTAGASAQGSGGYPASMTRRRITSGEQIEWMAAYSRAVVDGRDVFVSGTSGFKLQNMALDEDTVAQCRQAFVNLNATLVQAGACMDDVVRVTYVVSDAAEFERCWPVIRERFDQARPAMTVLVGRTLDERVKFQVEATARKRP